MKKIPTIYLRDFDGTLGPPGRFLLRDPHPDCDWVFNGEGLPTRKIDGTCCLIRGGAIYRRHEVKTDKRTGNLKAIPDLFTEIERDPETGNIVGWVPCYPTNPADARHIRAFALLIDALLIDAFASSRPPMFPQDGTWELVGPSVNGNPEGYDDDTLIPHNGRALILDDVPTGYDDLSAYLSDGLIEGVVWHHPDGRMAKIKGRDFGHDRQLHIYDAAS